jgi:hypothetical protein
VLCFQRPHFDAGCIYSMQAAFKGYENPVRECKTEACSQRISCVLLCIFLLLQPEMRGLCVAAVVAAALGHVKDLRSCAYASFARLQVLLHYLRLVTVGCSEHVANR